MTKTTQCFTCASDHFKIDLITHSCRRIVTEMLDKDCKRIGKHVILQYVFTDGKEINFEITAFHKNSKSKKPYFVTKKSVLEASKNQLNGKTNKQIIDTVYKESNGIMSDDPGSFVKSRLQMAHLRYRQGTGKQPTGTDRKGDRLFDIIY